MGGATPAFSAVLALATLFAVAHASDKATVEKVKENNNRAGTGDFNYDQINKWGDLSPTCAGGTAQSPIDMQIQGTSSDGSQPDIKLNEAVVAYQATTNNFQFDCTAAIGDQYCSTVTYRGEVYHMLQAHFHSPSEHHIDGQTFDLEIHFVHKAEKSDQLLVLGVVFEVGKKNEDVQKLLDSAQEQNKQVVDFPAFIQPGAELCTYEGSLTTPPCTEGVHWLVSNSRLSVSLKQVGQYREMVGELKNARPIQATSVKAHPEARCYGNPKFSGGIAKKPSATGPSTNTDSGHGSGSSRATGSGESGSGLSSGTQVSGGVSTAPAAQACFPADATVQLRDGRTATMADLRIGDEVAVGRGQFSPVFMFSHRDAGVVTEHVHITLSSGRALILSPGHHLSQNGVVGAAANVRVGDALLSADGAADVAVAVERTRAQGLFNPHTLAGAIVVDGVLCSTYTQAVAPPAAHALLAPVRWLFAAGAVSEGSAGSFLRYGAQAPLM